MTEKEKSLNATFNSFIEIGLGIENNYHILEELAVDDIMGYGTAVDEKLFSLSALKKLMITQEKLIEGVKVLWERTPVLRRISADGNSAVFADDILGSMVVENENMQMYLRFSCVLEFIHDKWQMVHWHGSKPENVQSEVDSFGIEKWKERNTELEKLVVEKTADLLTKNRQLEIEAALEKIRTKSLAMYKTDDLGDVVTVLFEQMQGLSVAMEFASVSIFIFKEGTRNLDQWIQLPAGVASLHVPYFEHPILSDLFDAKESSADYFAKVYTLEEKNSWVAKGFELTDYKNLPLTFKTSLLEAPGYAMSITLAKNSGICIPSFIGAFPSAGDVNILKRAGKVFEQTYTRFLDLQKAESQAREAHIEAALERTRTQSMIMQHSKELDDTLRVFHEQVLLLGINSAFSFLWLPDDEKDKHKFWAAWSEDKGGSAIFKSKAIDYTLDRNEPATAQCLIDWKSGEPVFSYAVPPEGVEAYFAARQELIDGVEKLTPGHFRDGLCYVEAFMKYGCFGVMVQIDLNQEEKKILCRFANEFEHTYTRFLDLQKAEAQAREAKIEAALEKIRSRTMAMQHSDELQYAAILLFQQVQSLGIKTGSCGFFIWMEDEKTAMVWNSSQEGGLQIPFKLPHKEIPHYKRVYEAAKKGDEFHVEEVAGEALEKQFNYLRKLDGIKEIIKKYEDAGFALPSLIIYHDVFFKQGYLSFHTHEPAVDAHDIFKRFGKVFEQTYTRFLDLQKAEAQAREAKIETALEKIRSRTMAMQNSNELPEAANLLFLQVQALGIPAWSAGYNILAEDKKSATCWMSSEGTLQKPFQLRLWGEASFDEMGDFLHSNKTMLVQELGDQALDKHYAYMKSFPDLKSAFDDIDAKGLSLPTYQINHLCRFTQGFLLFITYEKVPESQDIFKRFTKVFEQTYTRFLDLQKAEARARESQIEASLEKVRSRTMGMQKSDELGDVATILFKELNQLVDNLWTCGFVLCEKGKAEDEWWLSDENGFIPAFNLPNVGDVTHANIYNGWKNGATYHTEQLEGEALQEHYDWLMSLPVARKIFDDMLAAGFKLPNWQKLHCAYFKTGYLVIITQVPCPEEEIFKRFAQVFDLIYTRFLDLQKAEAQVREAQIEIAVERIRTKALAMYKSEEILSVAVSLREEMVKLNLQGVIAATIFLEQANGNYRLWDLTEMTDIEDGARLSLDIDFNPDTIDSDLFFLKFLRSTERYLIVETNKADFEKWAAWYRHYDAAGADKFLQYLQTTSITQSWHAAVPLEKGRLKVDFTNPPPKEMEIILPKMAAAFDLAYTRFLDIQKAEAQAREAQIELALERVRSQAMAMQKSSDLLDIVVTMRNEFIRLGYEAHYFWHMMWLPDKYEKAMTSGDGTKIGFVMELPRHIHSDIPLLAKWEKSNNPTVVYAMDLEEALDYVGKMISLGDFQHIDPQAPSHDDIRHIGGLTFIMARTTHGEIGYSLPGVVENPPKEDLEILVRFAGAFDIAHRRFLDLQKSEAQSREVEIELALEKVRSRSMGMQKSEELKEVIKIVNQQLTHLKIKLDHAGFVVDYTPKGDWHFWIADELDVPSKITHPYFESVWATQFNEAKDKDADFFVTQLNFEEKNKFYNELLSYIPDLPEASKDFYLSCPGLAATTVLFNNVSLYIENFQGIPYSEEENKILMRFGKVFQQTYTRFVDLQKAEASARESKIEAALEKVRSRSLAMHKSDELNEVVSVLFEKLKDLQIPFTAVGIAISIDGSKDLNAFVCGENEAGLVIINYRLPYFKNQISEDLYGALEKQLDFFVGHYSKEEKDSFYNNLIENTAEFMHLPEDIKRMIFGSQSYTISMMAVKNAVFNINDFEGKVLGEKETDILKRFAKVFDQSYTRFLDLKKAEAQTREAEINLAVERVRATALAMFQKGDLHKVNQELMNQVTALDPTGISGVSIWLFDDQDLATCYDLSSPGKMSDPLNFSIKYNPNNFDMLGEPWRIFKEKNRSYFILEYPIERIKRAVEEWEQVDSEMANVLREALVQRKLKHQWNPFGVFANGLLSVDMITAPTDDTKAIVVKMAGAFNLAYQRFLDLQKAEEQTREAQINLAVERVRARALAMFKSEEILEVVIKLKEEVIGLDIPGVAAAAILLKEKNGMFRSWDLTSLELNGESMHTPLDVPFDMEKTHPDFYLRKVWEKGTNYTVVVQDTKSLQITCDWLRENNKVKEAEEAEQFIKDSGLQKGYHPTVPLNNGRMILDLLAPPADEIESILTKMGGAFDLAYKRFEDLKNSEEQLREAQIEAALERVRARALAMQQPEELKEVAEVLRQEMGVLGVEELETCSIYINDENAEKAECWYALKDLRSDEKKLVNDYFALHLNDTWVGREMLKFYKSANNKTSIVMQGANRKEWINYCEEKSVAFRGYYGDAIPDRTYHLYKFSHGAIGAATPGDISDESFGLLKRAASVFSLAYSRFKDLSQARIDLQRLKEEKQRAEDALTNLQAAQKQLVQSEKMASLGELTAGIAHEIQNPLNFVNNFSEVNTELIDELKAELAIGNMQLAIELANDIKENEQKINHHGKRAGDIVKGMLQHSRSSSGVKEPTDINALCDEYLRLSYHGLRAKDKSFNATIKTDFDNSIGKINIIPQDIGRVVLNLLTNAFYAVNEKTLSAVSTPTAVKYEPTVSVSTKKIGDRVEIKVSDNGNGIPQKILDKIFQPFFTTKPTGQGTGLGLSLSYDIVKAHGGEIKVETKEGEGTTFIINLPVTHV